MKRNHITSCLILLILAAFSLSISGCSHKNKEIVVTKNVKSAANQEENQIKKDIELGNQLLDSGKYDDAKNAYNKAIELDKKNKKTYLTIKDKYLGKNRIQDAIDILQQAINNNVDTVNMKRLLSQLQAKLEASKAIEENNKRKNEKQNSNNNNSGDSQKATVVQNKRIIGIVKNMYERNGNRYLTIDEVEFYRGDKALQEAAKDGYGNKEDIEDYYIRDTDKSVTEYEVSSSCGFNTDGFQLDPAKAQGSSENQAVSYNKIKSIINARTNEDTARGEDGKSLDRANLYWLIINNNAVVQMDAQFTP